MGDQIIRVATTGEVTIHKWPEGSCSEKNKALRQLIGHDCRIYEHVMPNRLYTEFHQSNRPTKIAGQCVSMLIDEEGLLKEGMTPNLVGSYLYETDEHQIPIMGNILFVGEEWTGDGISFCGIEESVLKTLEAQINNMVYAMKAMLEVLVK